MLQPAIEILNAHRVMAISTARPDGWPQTTIVGYANRGWTVYFAIFRSSQKFANISHDDRISIAVGSEPRSLGEAKAVYAAGHATEIIDETERQMAWQLLVERHPNLAEFYPPDGIAAVLMRTACKYVSMVDYSKGIGHSDALTVDDGRAEAGHPIGERARRPRPESASRGETC